MAPHHETQDLQFLLLALGTSQCEPKTPRFVANQQGLNAKEEQETTLHPSLSFAYAFMYIYVCSSTIYTITLHHSLSFKYNTFVNIAELPTGKSKIVYINRLCLRLS